jgi:hypothetical protein
MQTITIPLEEYQKLKNMVNLVSDHTLLSKLNTLIDLMYENKYGLFMKDFVDDLTEQTIINCWDDKPSPWDNV